MFHELSVRVASAMCVVGFASHAGAAVRFANAGLMSGANDGSSWTNAFRGPLSLQSAIAAAQPGDQVWVASGIYRPALAGAPASSTFHLKENVKVFGGFAGNEATADLRNPSVNTCVLDGDLDGAANTFPPNQSYHVVTATALSAATILDGFVIRGGVAADFGDDAYGGGMVVFGGAPTIRNCSFIDNEAEGGAGLALLVSTSTVEGCFFGPNYAQMGAGMVNLSGAPVIRNCTFGGEYPSTGGNTGLGIYSGSLSGVGNPDLILEGCQFSIVAREFTCPAGVAVATGEGLLRVRDCKFIGNIGCGSGAMQVEGVVEIDRTVFIGNEGKFDGGAAFHSFDADITVTNSLFAGNDRLGFSTIFVGGKLRMSNCTLAYNGSETPAPGSGAHYLIVNQHADIAVANSIIWGNVSTENDATVVLSPFATGPFVPRFDSCIVQSWGAFVSPVAGLNTFAADPKFVAVPGVDGIAGTEDDNLHLQPISPAIDRGDNSLLGAAFVLDLDKKARRRDDPGSSDFTPGAAPQVDLGAYEFIPACPGDLNSDGIVEDADFVLFAAAYDLLDCAAPAMPAGCPSDLNDDGSVDDADFVVFANAYDTLVCP